MASRVVTTHVPIAIARRLDGFSSRMKRSRSWIVMQALNDWIGRQDAANPAPPTDLDPAEKAAASLKILREYCTLDDVSWRNLRNAGRS